MNRWNRTFLLLFICVGIASCSTYPHSAQNAFQAFYSGDFQKSSELLEAKSKEEGKDQLLYLFDRGMALQLAGRYKESSRDWLAADRMSEVKDYVSLSAEAATLIVSDKTKSYKGEDFEKVIINAFLAINFLMENNLEEALVECRRVNQKLYKYKHEAKRNYEQNPFARYLSAMIWEASGNLEDAYIDYVETQKIFPDFPYLKFDLLRLSKKLHRDDDYKKWKTEFAITPVPSLSKAEEKSTGEVVIIVQQGRSAIKRPNPQFHVLPKFYPRFSLTQSVRAEVDEIRESSQKIYSVSEVAIKNLDDAYVGMIAKKGVGLVGKYVLAEQVRQKNELLGFLTWIGLNAADEADLRSWTTLPETIQIIRMRIPKGDQKVLLVGLDQSQNPTGEQKEFLVNVRPGKKSFLTWRTMK